MNRKKSFTLIEIIVVTALISLILPALFTIVFAVLVEQIKLYRLTEVKKQGDYGINIIENTLRNRAVAVYSSSQFITELCGSALSSSSQTDGSNFYFKDRANDWFKFSALSDRIASSSAVVATTNLTTAKVKVSNFLISCKRQGLFSSPVVKISFTISYATTSQLAQNNASLNYSISIKLRKP